jgi:hypothetical protein
MLNVDTVNLNVSLALSSSQVPQFEFRHLYTLKECGINCFTKKTVLELSYEVEVEVIMHFMNIFQLPSIQHHT